MFSPAVLASAVLCFGLCFGLARFGESLTHVGKDVGAGLKAAGLGVGVADVKQAKPPVAQSGLVEAACKLESGMNKIALGLGAAGVAVSMGLVFFASRPPGR